MKLTILISGAALLGLLACAKQPETVAAAGSQQSVAAKPAPQSAVLPAGQSATLPAGHPDISAIENRTVTPPAPPQAGRITGKILETMNAGGYTYMRLGTAEGDVWTAVRETKVKKGATVTVEPQMVAEKFQSSTLHRTFDRLVMGVLADKTVKPASLPETPPNPMGTAAQHMTSAANIGDVKVEKAERGITIAEAWAKRNELKGKPVVIRGKVVKFLAGIMGKNWIHLRDGSGVRAEGNDDITVTTDEVAKVGDVVTVSGTVNVDKDFGAGYMYPVIVEDARLKK